MSTIEILQQARDLISLPDRWSQVGYDGTVKLNGADVASRDAECFCAVGACSAVSGHSIISVERSELYRLLSEAAGGDIIDYNDAHSHVEVLATFDRAIEKAKASAGAA